MKLTRIILTLTFAIALLGMTSSAMADTLNFTNGFTTCPTWGCASVVVGYAGGPNTGLKATITVTSLLNGYQFDNFGFNLGSGATITGFTIGAGSTVNTSDPSYGLSGPGSFNLNGFGNFDYLFKTGINGGSTGGDCHVDGAGNWSGACRFVLNLTGTGLTAGSLQQFSDPGGADGPVWFAGHVAGTSCTGFVGGPDGSGHSGTSGACTSTPEPASFNLLFIGGGLSTICLVLRRKLRK